MHTYIHTHIYLHEVIKIEPDIGTCECNASAEAEGPWCRAGMATHTGHRGEEHAADASRGPQQLLFCVLPAGATVSTGVTEERERGEGGRERGEGGREIGKEGTGTRRRGRVSASLCLACSI